MHAQAVFPDEDYGRTVPFTAVLTPYRTVDDVGLRFTVRVVVHFIPYHTRSYTAVCRYGTVRSPSESGRRTLVVSAVECDAMSGD